MATNLRYSQIITLKDGRKLGYAEYGVPTGFPVLGFHGTPGSRLMMKVVENAALVNGVRLIAPDRPGYGLSQPNRKATMLRYIDDIIELTKDLNIERFAVIGASGGGPYTLACAYRIPTCVSRIGLISGIGPLSLPGNIREMIQANRIMFQVGRVSPRLAGLLLSHLIKSSLPSMEQHIKNGTSPTPDLSPEIFAIVAADQQETIRAGGQGIVFDMQVLWRDWGFNLEDVQSKVYLWHGEADNLAPASLAHYIADHLADCEATFFPNEGHTDMFTKHIHEIMAKIVDIY
jgi:pimeloyl-ACP methyl ester carboxylesterase